MYAKMKIWLLVILAVAASFFLTVKSHTASNNNLTSIINKRLAEFNKNETPAATVSLPLTSETQTIAPTASNRTIGTPLRRRRKTKHKPQQQQQLILEDVLLQSTTTQQSELSATSRSSTDTAWQSSSSRSSSKSRTLSRSQLLSVNPNTTSKSNGTRRRRTKTNESNSKSLSSATSSKSRKIILAQSETTSPPRVKTVMTRSPLSQVKLSEPRLTVTAASKTIIAPSDNHAVRPNGKPVKKSPATNEVSYFESENTTYEGSATTKRSAVYVPLRVTQKPSTNAHSNPNPAQQSSNYASDNVATATAASTYASSTVCPCHTSSTPHTVQQHVTTAAPIIHTGSVLRITSTGKPLPSTSPKTISQVLSSVDEASKNVISKPGVGVTQSAQVDRTTTRPYMWGEKSAYSYPRVPPEEIARHTNYESIRQGAVRTISKTLSNVEPVRPQPIRTTSTEAPYVVITTLKPQTPVTYHPCPLSTPYPAIPQTTPKPYAVKVTPTVAPVVYKPAPVAKVTPAPVLRVTQAPVVKVTPAPIVKVTPAPVVRVTPVPVLRVTQAPVVKVTPAPIVKVTPAPVLRVTAAPVLRVTAVPKVQIQTQLPTTTPKPVVVIQQTRPTTAYPIVEKKQIVDIQNIYQQFQAFGQKQVSKAVVAQPQTKTVILKTVQEYTTPKPQIVATTPVTVVKIQTLKPLRVQKRPVTTQAPIVITKPAVVPVQIVYPKPTTVQPIIQVAIKEVIKPIPPPPPPPPPTKLPLPPPPPPTTRPPPPPPPPPRPVIKPLPPIPITQPPVIYEPQKIAVTIPCPVHVPVTVPVTTTPKPYVSLKPQIPAKIYPEPVYVAPVPPPAVIPIQTTTVAPKETFHYEIHQHHRPPPPPQPPLAPIKAVVPQVYVPPPPPLPLAPIKAVVPQVYVPPPPPPPSPPPAPIKAVVPQVYVPPPQPVTVKPIQVSPQPTVPLSPIVITYQPAPVTSPKPLTYPTPQKTLEYVKKESVIVKPALQTSQYEIKLLQQQPVIQTAIATVPPPPPPAPPSVVHQPCPFHPPVVVVSEPKPLVYPAPSPVVSKQVVLSEVSQTESQAGYKVTTPAPPAQVFQEYHSKTTNQWYLGPPVKQSAHVNVIPQTIPAVLVTPKPYLPPPPHQQPPPPPPRPHQPPRSYTEVQISSWPTSPAHINTQKPPPPPPAATPVLYPALYPQAIQAQHENEAKTHIMQNLAEVMLAQIRQPPPPPPPPAVGPAQSLEQQKGDSGTSNQGGVISQVNVVPIKIEPVIPAGAPGQLPYFTPPPNLPPGYGYNKGFEPVPPTPPPYESKRVLPQIQPAGDEYARKQRSSFSDSSYDDYSSALNRPRNVDYDYAR